MTGVPSVGRAGSRIGATALPARVRTPAELTFATEANNTGSWSAAAPPVPPVAALTRPATWTVIRGVPVITVNASSGAEVNRAT